MKKKIKIKGFCGVYFWMQRVAEEYCTKAADLIKESNTLHYQSTNFEEMHEETQDKIVKELCDKMKELGWEDSVKEYFEKEN